MSLMSHMSLQIGIWSNHYLLYVWKAKSILWKKQKRYFQGRHCCIHDWFRWWLKSIKWWLKSIKMGTWSHKNPHNSACFGWKSKNYMSYQNYSLSSFQQDQPEGSSFSRLEMRAKWMWKCYQIMNVAYGLTKIFKARLCSLEKAKTIWGTETTRRDLSIETNQKFVASAV